MSAVLTIDSREPLELADKLATRELLQDSMDRTAQKTRTQIKRAVRKRLGIKDAEVKKRIHLHPARGNPLEVVFDVSREPISFGKFRVAQLKRAGARVRIGQRTETFRGAFKARMRSGHEGVFRRVKETRSRKGLPWGSPELEIRELYGPSAANMFEDEWSEHGEAFFRREYPEQLFRLLGRARRGR